MTPPALNNEADLFVVTCPNCRTPNDLDRKYCVECGHALTAGCKVCGATNPASAKFCGTCGNRLDGTVGADAGPVGWSPSLHGELVPRGRCDRPAASRLGALR